MKWTSVLTSELDVSSNSVTEQRTHEAELLELFEFPTTHYQLLQLSDSHNESL